MTLATFFEIAADNAQARDRDWDAYFHSMDRIYAWQEWMDRRRIGIPQ